MCSNSENESISCDCYYSHSCFFCGKPIKYPENFCSLKCEKLFDMKNIIANKAIDTYMEKNTK